MVVVEEVLVEDLVEEVVEEEDLEAEEVEVGVGTLTSGQETGLARTQGKGGFILQISFPAAGFTLGF